MSHLERPAVKRVRDALLAAGLHDTVMALAASARTAEDAAEALGCAQGAIVKSLVFCVGTRFVMALVAGDHHCLEANLPKVLNLSGTVRRPQASEVKGITGFTIGGVAPLGMTHPLPMALDTSLRRFDTIYAAAGHPNCIFPIAFTDLAR
ncbi:MAG: YbaK/EbsC family protein, partial [Rhodospirillales bacterium]